MMLILFDLCARGMCDECYSLSVWCGSSLDMIDAHVGILSLHCANPCTGHRLHLYCFARVVVFHSRSSLTRCTRHVVHIQWHTRTEMVQMCHR